jgi:glycosyltransferase involved in cell wall biosynthesis
MSKLMKVLFLSIDRGGPTLSAYEHRLRMLAAGLQRHGIATETVNLRHPLVRPILALPLNLPFLCSKLKTADFLHCGGDATYVASYVKAFLKGKIIMDVHGDSHSETRVKWEFRRDARAAYWLAQSTIMDFVAYKHSQLFLVVSKPQEERLAQKWHIRHRQIALVRNGVDLTVFHPSSHTRENGRFVVCYAGGFQPWQGLTNLVDAAEMLDAANIRIRIIGFTPRDEPLRKQIAARLGSRAELIDRLPQSQLRAQLSSADILVIPRSPHPAVEVALPTKFAEYAALGKAMIVCDVDETAELVRNNHCGLVSPPSAAGLAATIQSASSLGPDRLSEMGRNGRALAERELAWDVIGRNYASFLMSCAHAA